MNSVADNLGLRLLKLCNRKSLSDIQDFPEFVHRVSLTPQAKREFWSLRQRLYNILRKADAGLPLRQRFVFLDQSFVVVSNNATFCRAMQTEFPYHICASDDQRADVVLFTPNGQRGTLFLGGRTTGICYDAAGFVRMASLWFQRRSLRVRSHALVHASSVQLGRVCILLVGPTTAGKSTLLLEACRLGASPCDDDVTAIHTELNCVEPTQKPFKFRCGTGHDVAEALGVRPDVCYSFCGCVYVDPQCLPKSRRATRAPVWACVILKGFANATQLLALPKSQGFHEVQKYLFNPSLYNLFVLGKTLSRARYYQIVQGPPDTSAKAVCETVIKFLDDFDRQVFDRQVAARLENSEQVHGCRK